MTLPRYFGLYSADQLVGASPADPRHVDIRRKRPPALSFLLRWDTLRRLARVASLLALDFAGVFAAICTALMVKAVVRDGAHELGDVAGLLSKALADVREHR